MTKINQARIEHGVQQRERIMKFIAEYIEEHGFSPSVRDIANALDYNTTSAPYYQLLRLEKENRISYTHGMARGITIVK